MFVSITFSPSVSLPLRQFFSLSPSMSILVSFSLCLSVSLLCLFHSNSVFKLFCLNFYKQIYFFIILILLDSFCLSNFLICPFSFLPSFSVSLCVTSLSLQFAVCSISWALLETEDGYREEEEILFDFQFLYFPSLPKALGNAVTGQ